MKNARTWLGSSCLVILLGLSSGSEPIPKAVREKKALELVSAAVKAHGGVEIYKRCQYIKTQSTLEERTTPKSTVKYNIVSYSMPGACRIEVTEIAGGKQHVVVQQGEDAWMTYEGKLVSLTKEELTIRRETSTLTAANDLIPLVTSERFSVTVADDIEVQNKRLKGVCAYIPGDKNKVFLYFNEKNLLERSIYQIAGEADSVMDYKDYRKVEGYMRPHKKVTSANEAEQSIETNLKYTILSKIDKELFKKPSK